MTDLPPTTPTRFESDIEGRLFRVFQRIGTGFIAKVYEGTIRVLTDDGNPSRFIHAAHSIRNITMLLAREIERKIIEAIENDSENTEINTAKLQVLAAFEKLIAYAVFDDEQAKKVNLQSSKQKLNDTMRDFLAGKASMKSKLKSLFGDKKDFERMPKPAYEEVDAILNTWDYCQHYFTGISKDGEIVDATKFKDTWVKIQGCWWAACCQFADAAPEIDKIISQGPPPHEG